MFCYQTRDNLSEKNDPPVAYKAQTMKISRLRQRILDFETAQAVSKTLLAVFAADDPQFPWEDAPSARTFSEFVPAAGKKLEKLSPPALAAGVQAWASGSDPKSQWASPVKWQPNRSQWLPTTTLWLRPTGLTARLANDLDTEHTVPCR
jgi:hypothetical protein